MTTEAVDELATEEFAIDELRDEELLLTGVEHTPAVVCAPSIFNESIFARPSAVAAASFSKLLPCTKSISMLAVVHVVHAPVAGNVSV